ncbi:MAG: hypothetical protein ABJB11_19365 [Ferruginibacter sp.]
MTLEHYPSEDRPEAESKTWGGVEPCHATNENNNWKIFFSSMFEEILDIRDVQKSL